jgi:hypothetical protein
MEIRSLLTGRRGVSLPFTDYCDSIVDGEVRLQELLDLVIEYGKKQGWKSLELRSINSFMPLTSRSLIYLGHTVDLLDKEDHIFSNFRNNNKRNIRRAIKERVRIEISNSLKSISEFYRLNCKTRKRHGLPPQPFSFFSRIHDHVVSKNLGLIILAYYGQKAIAGAVYFHFSDKAVYKYGASDMGYQELRANHLVMWQAIKYYCQKGFKSLFLGRTEPENRGLLQFKTGWGANEQQINYYRYDFKKEAFLPGSPKVMGFHTKIFRKMPAPILNKVGSILYRHVG